MTLRQEAKETERRESDGESTNRINVRPYPSVQSTKSMAYRNVRAGTRPAGAGPGRRSPAGV